MGFVFITSGLEMIDFFKFQAMKAEWWVHCASSKRFRHCKFSVKCVLRV